MRTGNPSDLLLRAEDGTLHPLQPVNLIGREAECQIALADSQISRYHAKLIVTGPGTVLVEDLRSTNGTFINGQRLQAPHVLSVGDELCLHQLRFRLATADSGTAEATTLAGPGLRPNTPIPEAPAAGDLAAGDPAPGDPAAAPTTVATDPDATYLLKSEELARLQAVVRKDMPLRRPGAVVEGPCLVVLSAPIRGKVFPLQPASIVASWTIGRDPGTDIALIDRSVSKQHLRITKHGARWRFESLSATNQVFINGAAAEAGELRFGDRIRLGRTELEFRASQEPGAPLPAPSGRWLRPLAWTVAALAALLLATAVAVYFFR